jgi:hypothetical protein
VNKCARPDGYKPVKNIPEPKGGISWNDLKDKPFYTEMEVILEKQTVDGFVENGGLYGVMLPNVVNISDGEVSVYWDGVEYACIAAGGFIGNKMVMGEADSGEPFAILCDERGTTIASVTDNKPSHEIGIVGEVSRPIDAKYLPDTVVQTTMPKDCEALAINGTAVLYHILGVDAGDTMFNRSSGSIEFPFSIDTWNILNTLFRSPIAYIEFPSVAVKGNLIGTHTGDFTQVRGKALGLDIHGSSVSVWKLEIAFIRNFDTNTVTVEWDVNSTGLATRT